MKDNYVVVARCYWDIHQNVLLYLADGEIETAYDNKNNRNLKITNMTFEEAEELVKTFRQNLNLRQDKKNLLKYVGEPHIILDSEESPVELTSRISTGEFAKFVNCSLAHMKDETVDISEHSQQLLLGIWGGQ